MFKLLKVYKNPGRLASTLIAQSIIIRGLLLLIWAVARVCTLPIPVARTLCGPSHLSLQRQLSSALLKEYLQRSLTQITDIKGKIMHHWIKTSVATTRRHFGYSFVTSVHLVTQAPWSDLKKYFITLYYTLWILDAYRERNILKVSCFFF